LKVPRVNVIESVEGLAVVNASVQTVELVSQLSAVEVSVETYKSMQCAKLKT